MFRKRKTFKEPDLNWQNFYTSFLQVSPQNYSLEEVFNISIPYFEYLIYEDDVLKSCLTYEYSIISNKNDIGSIIKGNKYLSLLFDNFLKYEEINKLINFYSIKNVIEDMELDKKLIGYVYEDLEIDIKFLNTKIEYFYKDSTENDKNSEPINKGTSLYKSGGAIVKLYGEEPKTFKGLRWITEVSTDDKYHVAIQYNNIATVYVPLNNTVNFVSK